MENQNMIKTIKCDDYFAILSRKCYENREKTFINKRKKKKKKKNERNFFLYLLGGEYLTIRFQLRLEIQLQLFTVKLTSS